MTKTSNDCAATMAYSPIRLFWFVFMIIYWEFCHLCMKNKEAKDRINIITRTALV